METVPDVFSSVIFKELLADSYKTKDEKVNIIFETITKLFHQFYEDSIKIIQTQILQFVKEIKRNRTNPHRLNYLFNKIVNIQRARSESELKYKLNQIKLILFNENDEESNLIDDINFKHDINIEQFNEQYLTLMDSMNKLFEGIQVKLDEIFNENLRQISEANYENEQLTDFNSDTEFEARIKLANLKLVTKVEKCYSDGEIDKLVKFNYMPWNYDDDDDEECSDDEDSANDRPFFDLNFSPQNSTNNTHEILNELDKYCNSLNNSQLNDHESYERKTGDLNDEIQIIEEVSTKAYSFPRIRLGMRVFALKDSSIHKWQPAIITRIIQGSIIFYNCKFEKDFDFKKFQIKAQNLEDIAEDDDESEYDAVQLPPTCVAYSEPVDEHFILPVKTRIVTLYQNENESRAPFFSVGTIAEIPNARNLNRYLIFFDDGFAQYVHKFEAFQVFEPNKVPNEQLNEDHLEFLKRYFAQYPEKAMVRLHKNHVLKTFYLNKWHVTKVTDVDCSLVRLHFEEINHYEWVYRGSYRLLPFYEKLKQHEFERKTSVARQHFGMRSKDNSIEYTNIGCDELLIKSYSEKFSRYISAHASTLFPTQKQTARKSSSCNNIRAMNQPRPPNLHLRQAAQGQTKFLDLKDTMVRPEMVKFKPHPCTSSCVYRWEIDIDKRYKCINPLLIPMIYGWQRHVSTQSRESNSRNRKCVNYIAPCGRRLRSIKENDKYLYFTQSNLTIDMFSFDPLVHTDREFEANKTFVNIEDVSYGIEEVPISCVNCVDSDHPPAIKYSKIRVPQEGVPLNTDENLLDGCDCDDGCRDRLKCSCWRKTYEATTFINSDKINTNVGYKGRRLLESVNTGIFECNSRCKCDKRCSNRVVQNSISARLQLFKTASKGWGLRCLDDVPRGTFICIYTGDILTEDQSDIRGKDLGDEYFAELDFIECVRRLKDGYISDQSFDEDDLYENDDEIICVKRIRNTINTERSKTSKDEIECLLVNTDEEDENTSFRRRQLVKNRQVSDDILKNNRFFTNTENVFFFENYLKSSQVYIMDAKICGNIGRYFNHSCSPNIFVQNVFVDTYDLRFPWIAFFSSQFIRAGTELCWDYNYTIDSVKGRQLYCHCGAAACRGRLL